MEYFNAENTQPSFALSDFADMLHNMLCSCASSMLKDEFSHLPNYFGFLFKLIDADNKGFICEHDLFTIIKHFKKKPAKQAAQSYQEVKYGHVDPQEEMFMTAFMEDLIAVSEKLNYPVVRSQASKLKQGQFNKRV